MFRRVALVALFFSLAAFAARAGCRFDALKSKGKPPHYLRLARLWEQPPVEQRRLLSELLGRPVLESDRAAIFAAHEAGRPSEGGKYGVPEFLKIVRALDSAGIRAPREHRLLIESGATGFLDVLAAVANTGNTNPIGNGIAAAGRLASGQSGGFVQTMKDIAEVQQGINLATGNYAGAYANQATKDAADGNYAKSAVDAGLAGLYANQQQSSTQQQHAQVDRRSESFPVESSRRSPIDWSTVETKPVPDSEPPRSVRALPEKPSVSSRRSSDSGTDSSEGTAGAMLLLVGGPVVFSVVVVGSERAYQSISTARHPCCDSDRECKGFRTCVSEGEYGLPGLCAEKGFRGRCLMTGGGGEGL